MLLFELLAALWFFVFGTVIGSFLNVIVWRTPRGESIVGPSRCPQCKAAIRWYNNVPVLGWVWLGGKCRDCRLPISPRYPLVEFICGAMFLAVALAELAQPSFVDVILDTNWVSVRVYGVHMLLLCALLAWALMQVDERKIPSNQIIWLWLLGLVLALLQPRYDARPATVNIAYLELSRAWASFLEKARGFVAGGLIGALLGAVGRWTWRADRALAIAVALASVGLFLGVEPTLQIALVALVLGTVSLILSWPISLLRSIPFTMDIFVAAIAYLCWHDTAAWTDVAIRLYLQ